MNWILACLLMFVASALLYTYIRFAQKRGLSTVHTSIAMFVVPTPLYLVYALVMGSSLSVTLPQLAVLALSSLFLSWLGNWFSLKSIEGSPNPGYSLIISKSYVVFTSLASVYLFSSPLSLQQSIGIGVIILFSALIILSEKRQEKQVASMRWVWLAFGAFFCWGGLALVSKYLLSEGVSVAARLLYMHVFVTLILYLEMYWRKLPLLLSRPELKIMLPIGVGGFCFNLFMQLGFQFAPNPGFVNAANAASISLVAILAALFFKDELNGKKLFGIIGVTVGMLFLFL